MKDKYEQNGFYSPLVLFNVDQANNFNEALEKISSSEKKLINCIGSLYNVGNILNKN